MRFRMNIIAVLFAICMLLSGCKWVSFQDKWHTKLFPMTDGEVRILAEVFGDEVMDHVDSGRLTKDEYQAYNAYWAGMDHVERKYSRYMHNIKMESFNLMSDDTYEIVFTYDGTTSFICRICPGTDGFECSDDFEPPGQ